jgi:hypothetical protein
MVRLLEKAVHTKAAPTFPFAQIIRIVYMSDLGGVAISTHLTLGRCPITLISVEDATHTLAMQPPLSPLRVILDNPPDLRGVAVTDDPVTTIETPMLVNEADRIALATTSLPSYALVM